MYVNDFCLKIIDNKKCLNYNYNYIKQKNIGGKLMNVKGRKGITLVALIVTIIVPFVS